jgi:glycine/D-amino acid oxidase-like deaminating enzyme
MGADYLEAEVARLRIQRKRADGVRLTTGDNISAGHVVLSAGAWVPAIARTAGIHLPVEPIMRQVFVLETNARPERTIPLTVTPSGLYLIHEHDGTFMCGQSLPDDPVGFDFSWDRQRFLDRLWPGLLDLVPTFERLKVVRGWAGLYAVNQFDGNAIVGAWPGYTRLMLMTGFSGHGFQQCHALGRYLAELILDLPLSLDLSRLSPARILENQPVFENATKLV